MTDFEIFTDSAANLPDDLRVGRKINMIPFGYILDGQEYSCLPEGVPFRDTAKRFYSAMREGKEIKTSLISESRFIEALTPALDAGKDVILVTMAAGISGTYQQAVNAQAALQKQFTDRKICVVDSANASLGEGIIALRIADLRDMGESVESCLEWCKENIYKLNSYLTVDDLKYLHRGGRISKTLALAGNLLNLKPLIKADGGAPAKLTTFGKTRGRKKALSALVENFDSEIIRPEGQTVAIAHADCEDEAMQLAQTLKDHGAADVIVEYYDICTGAHVGPGTIAIFFFGKDRRPPIAMTEPSLQGAPKASKI